MSQNPECKSRISTRASIIRQLAALTVGESTVFVRDLKPNETAQKFSSLLSNYAFRGVVGTKWKIEAFYVITSRRRPIIGVIMTRDA